MVPLNEENASSAAIANLIGIVTSKFRWRVNT